MEAASIVSILKGFAIHGSKDIEHRCQGIKGLE